MDLLFRILLAFSAGVTIVLARSINAFLANKIGAYQSSFFNYFTGFIASVIALLLFSFPTLSTLQQMDHIPSYFMFLGGMIGVVNIVILNIVCNKLAPIQLTLIVFVAQLGSGILLDYTLFDLFSLKKMVGCCIVVLGLLHYQYVQRKDTRKRIG